MLKQCVVQHMNKNCISHLADIYLAKLKVKLKVKNVIFSDWFHSVGPS